MADSCYNFRSLDERRQIQQLWDDGAGAKEISEQLSIPLSSLYAELKKGQDGTRLPDQRLKYDADLAQLRAQEALERRGRRAAGA